LFLSKSKHVSHLGQYSWVLILTIVIFPVVFVTVTKYEVVVVCLPAVVLFSHGCYHCSLKLRSLILIHVFIPFLNPLVLLWHAVLLIRRCRLVELLNHLLNHGFVLLFAATTTAHLVFRIFLERLNFRSKTKQFIWIDSSNIVSKIARFHSHVAL